MISALMVTRAARFALAEHAIGDFAAQTERDRELVVLHDGSDADDAGWRALAERHPHADIRIVRAPAGLALGDLRNRSIDAARGEIVCQWDDDDRHHPERLALQHAALREQRGDACFLVDQLHWFLADGTMFWDDWDREPYPMNFVQGTLFGFQDRLPRYPPLARGEDTVLVREMLRARQPVARLAGVGWCYVYVHHGANVFPQAHHAAISRAKRLGASFLCPREGELRRRLAEYQPPIRGVRLPHEAGEIVID